MYLCIPKKAAHRVLAAVLCAAAAGGVLLGLGWPRAEAEPAAVAAASYEWGLSFQTENEPPIPNLSAEKLRPFDAFYCGDAEQKRLYLTFDEMCIRDSRISQARWRSGSASGQACCARCLR